MHVNDIHSGLNACWVRRVERPASIDAVCALVAAARHEGRSLAISGGRHAMGGQQFLASADLLDMTGLTRVVDFDPMVGEVEAEAGIMWPALIDWLDREQSGNSVCWSIVQKQTGADRLTLGGAVSANAHGRVLRRGPIEEDIIALSVVDATGAVRRCSRAENADLFRLVIGGYGLFGPIVSVRLRLMPRHKVRRHVVRESTTSVVATLEQAAGEGAEFGDFQFAIDPGGPDFLRDGICATYWPLPDDTLIPEEQRALSSQDWAELIALAHANPRRASDLYSQHYLTTDGQVYWSDRHQMADYLDGYHAALDSQLGAPAPGSEMISEIYVPRAALASFMAEVADDFRGNQTPVVYGTVRLIERDDETFLAWARQDWACIVFNIHVDHTAAGVAAAIAASQRLIDRAIGTGGSYYLTYHRWARPDQVLAAHPRFIDFLRQKLRFDPEERFQSDWYRHYRAVFGNELQSS